MSHPDAEHIARQAQIDQFRAHAAAFLDEHIASYRKSIAIHSGSDSCAFSKTVATAVSYVDPGDALSTQQSNHLTFVAEVLAVAISRLAQASE